MCLKSFKFNWILDKNFFTQMRLVLHKMFREDLNLIGMLRFINVPFKFNVDFVPIMYYL